MAADEIADPKVTGSHSERAPSLAAKASDPANKPSHPDGIVIAPELRLLQAKIEGQPEAMPNEKPRGQGTVTSPRTGEAATAGTLKRLIESQVEADPAAKRDADREEAAAVGPINTRINDEYFIRDLGRLKELRSFLIQEAVSVAPSDSNALEFGRLNLLSKNYLPENMGRDPTEEEWNQVERHTRILFGLLTPSLRRRFVLGAIPGMLAWLPLFLAMIALVALVMAIMSYNVDLLRMGSVGANVLPFYLVWLMSLGAIGAIAFIGMNALSVQEDITFDLTNQRLIIMRIALGALFGLVLTLPFGFQEFLAFCQTIARGSVDLPGEQSPTVTVQAAMLVLPFILGFSTSLVILILNRFVDAVQGFFGRRSEGNGGTPAST